LPFDILGYLGSNGPEAIRMLGNGMQFIGRNKVKLILLLFLAGAVIFSRISGAADYLTFDALKEHRSALKGFVSLHYGLSVVIFCALFLSTAFFLPGAIALMIAAGFLFGVVEGVVYVNVAATTGAALAFLSSRYLIGNWIQERFALQLRHFNKEIKCHGQNYLFLLRIVPLFPFFVVNYLSGITMIPLSRFAWTTALGLAPASVLYAYAGRKLEGIDRLNDLFAPEIVATFVGLGLFALLPVFVRSWRRLSGQIERQ
jgi:uncharacterized membrane protein YdjX (TVP38/TMEM64 family)